MAKYRARKYAEFLYGGESVIALSVSPMSVLIRDFTSALVEWKVPTGDFTRIRLVRSQVGFPEDFEDGITVWEEYATEGTVSRNSIIDGVENPEVTRFVPGRVVYYRMFLYTDGKIWANAGSASALVPLDHQYQDKLLKFLPRVFTSIEQTPLGEVDTRVIIVTPGDTSFSEGDIIDYASFSAENASLLPTQTPAVGRYTNDLVNFLGGLGFTLEELVTYLELIGPNHSAFDTPATLLPLEFSNYGLTSEIGLPVKNQKRLVREVNYLYTRKGTELALGTYVESLTGYAPTITVSNNLLLQPQDATFYQSTGNWLSTNATIESSTEQLPEITANTFDQEYTCKLTVSSAGTMTLGEVAPITTGIPVLPSTSYNAFFYVKSPTSTGTFTLNVTYYDKNGEFAGAYGSPSVTASNTWQQVAVAGALSSDVASYATLTINFNSAGTYYLDQVCFRTDESLDYSEPRAIDILLEPNAKNLITNPSFEGDPLQYDWVDANATITASPDVPTEINSGATSAQITNTAGSGTWNLNTSSFSVENGQYYTLSFYIKNDVAINASLSSTDAYAELIVPVNTSWTRYSLTILVPAQPEGDVLVSLPDQLSVQFIGTTGTTLLDCVLLEKSITPSEYYDGSFPSEYGVVWSGTPFQSESHKYPGLPQKLPRLRSTLVEWVPMNSWWRILTSQGVEYTSLM